MFSGRYSRRMLSNNTKILEQLASGNMTVLGETKMVQRDCSKNSFGFSAGLEQKGFLKGKFC